MRKIFLDAGAWEGNSIAHFRTMYNDSADYDIHCFECHPKFIKKLKKCYPEVVVHDKAVWSNNTKMKLRVGQGKWGEGCSLIKDKKIKREGKSLNVECIDFAQWIKDNCNKDDYIVCKMNIEGAEYEIIPHLVKTGVINYINELYCEWHVAKIPSITAEKHTYISNLIPKTVVLKAWSLDHGRKCVYTVITDPKYKLHEPHYITPGWDMVCFTNLKLKSDYWDIRDISFDPLEPKKLSRKVKILNEHYLPGYNISLYIDSKFTPKRNLDKYVQGVLPKEFEMAVMRHNRRACPYQEADILKGMGIDATKQMARYRNIGLPEHSGLFAPGIMIRRHCNAQLRNMMRFWYEELMLKESSHRDMLSLSMAYWKYASDNVPEKKRVKVKLMYFKENYNKFIVREK